MRTPLTRASARVAAGLVSLAVVAAVPVALGADSSSLRIRAAALRAESSTTSARAQAAVLTLYSLESDLARARRALAAADRSRVAVVRERASTRRQLAVARASTLASERRLAELVRALYEQSSSDPIAVVLAAGSLDEALAGLDNLGRAAHENRRVLERARSARGRLARLDARLGRREAELRRASGAARHHEHALEAKAAERAAFVASLHLREGLSVRGVAALESRARAAERKSATLAAAPERSQAALTVPVPPAAAPSVATAVSAAAEPDSDGRTLTVSAVGYSLPGHTASGLPVGHGIVAVDPGVIPLGTRMYVPGYGYAVAADTGGAVRGAMMDLWFPSTAAALEWGRRTVAIVLR